MTEKKRVKEYDNKCALYIHIPFCVSKCAYCNFCSFAGKDEYIAEYVNRLCDELVYRAHQHAEKIITSIYIGGGTPSFLPLGAITTIVNCVKANYTLEENLSITIEGNPNSLTLEKLREYKMNGINRLSVGLQTATPELLKLLNRKHTVEDFELCIKNAKEVGFTNINADIIIGIPTQTMNDVKTTLECVLKQGIQHISAYGLILEEGTPLYKKVKRGEFKPLDDDVCNEMYDYVCERLKQDGFYRYEISNFSKIGFKSDHNLNYWHRGQYLGVGLDAYSFVDGVHWQNTNNLKEYLKNPTQIIGVEKETLKTAKLETIMLALRLDEGLDITKFNHDFHCDFLSDYGEVLKNLLNKNLVKIINNHLIIVDQHISNSIIAEFA